MQSTIGFVNGCFDLLHDGHIHLLTEARKHCDSLIIAFNSDESVRRLKGEGRPVHKSMMRRANLLRTRLAEVIVEFDTEDNLYSYIKSFKPNMLIKGADYEGKPVTGEELVEKVVYIPLLNGYSTTAQIKSEHVLHTTQT